MYLRKIMQNHDFCEDGIWYNKFYKKRSDYNIMKCLNVRLLTTACLFGLILSYQPTKALSTTHTPFVSDYVLIGASGGYSTLIGKTPEMSVPGLANGGFHFGWEVRREHFIYRPIFVELKYFSSSCNTNLTIPDVPIKDTQLGDAIMHYKMLSPLKETQRFFMPSIGFAFGYSGNNYSYSQLNGAFYFLAGIRLSLKLDIDNKANLHYETSATYDRYIDDYEDMPNHFYTDRNASEKVKYGSKVCGIFSGELGWELNMPHYDKFKIGAFLDLGFTNIMYGIETKAWEANSENAVDVMVHSYYNSPEMKGKYVVPLMTGLKITYLFNANIKRHCVSKNCRIGYRKHRFNR